jgi:hypothetical protein
VTVELAPVREVDITSVASPAAAVIAVSSTVEAADREDQARLLHRAVTDGPRLDVVAADDHVRDEEAAVRLCRALVAGAGRGPRQQDGRADDGLALLVADHAPHAGGRDALRARAAGGEHRPGGHEHCGYETAKHEGPRRSNAHIRSHPLF